MKFNFSADKEDKEQLMLLLMLEYNFPNILLKCDLTNWLRMFPKLLIRNALLGYQASMGKFAGLEKETLSSPKNSSFCINSYNDFQRHGIAERAVV